jgi:hypothetical protein
VTAPGPYAVRLDDLVAALDRVSDQANAQWRDSRTEATRVMFAAVGATAGLLREEITRRADALPEASPVAATPTSAHDDRAGGPERVTPPTAPDVKASALSSPPQQCGAYHPYLLNTPCQVVPGAHIGRTHIWNGPDGTTVTWRHQ